ncbi:unnamed protein product, partial [Didymodactylos carnosus]
SYYKQHPQLFEISIHTFKPTEPCVLSIDHRFYRAIIEFCDTNEIELRLVDFGEIVKIPVQDCQNTYSSIIT